MVKKNTMRFAKPVIKRNKEKKMAEVQPPAVPAYLQTLDCPVCQKVRAELLGSLQRSVANMQKIAAEGKGHDEESKTSPEYNRYFGCAIACDTMLKEYFGFPTDESVVPPAVKETH